MNHRSVNTHVNSILHDYLHVGFLFLSSDEFFYTFLSLLYETQSFDISSTLTLLLIILETPSYYMLLFLS